MFPLSNHINIKSDHGHKQFLQKEIPSPKAGHGTSSYLMKRALPYVE